MTNHLLTVGEHVFDGTHGANTSTTHYPPITFEHPYPTHPVDPSLSPLLLTPGYHGNI